MSTRRRVWYSRYQPFPALQYIQATNHRAGSTSFKDMTDAHPLWSNEQARKSRDSGWFIAQFVRHPLDRLGSLWRYFGPGNSRYTRIVGPSLYQWCDRLRLPREPSFDTFVRTLAETGEDDEHTALVHWQHCDEKGRIPEMLWPFEHINAGWEVITHRVAGLPRRLPHSNYTATVDWRNYFEGDELLQVATDWLAPDLEWHREVTENVGYNWRAP